MKSMLLLILAACGGTTTSSSAASPAAASDASELALAKDELLKLAALAKEERRRLNTGFPYRYCTGSCPGTGAYSGTTYHVIETGTCASHGYEVLDDYAECAWNAHFATPSSWQYQDCQIPSYGAIRGNDQPDNYGNINTGTGSTWNSAGNSNPGGWNSPGVSFSHTIPYGCYQPGSSCDSWMNFNNDAASTVDCSTYLCICKEDTIAQSQGSGAPTAVPTALPLPAPTAEPTTSFAPTPGPTAAPAPAPTAAPVPYPTTPYSEDTCDTGGFVHRYPDLTACCEDLTGEALDAFLTALGKDKLLEIANAIP